MSRRFMTSYRPAPRGDARAEMRLLAGVPSFQAAPASLLAGLVDRGYVLEARRGNRDLGRCRPGEILGELGIVGRRLRSATVVTATTVTVLHLDRDAFEELRASEPYFRTLVGEAVLRKTA
jgi:CRP-like cAMP-binding protein